MGIKTDKKKLLIGSIALALLFVCIIAIGIGTSNDNTRNYEKAKESYGNENYEEAYYWFSVLPESYRDVKTLKEVSYRMMNNSVIKENQPIEPKVEEGISREKKLEILSYINGILDPLLETGMTDEQLELKADEVWKDAEEKFSITENDIFNIMGDVDLTKEYYSNLTDSSQQSEIGETESTVITYDATLENDGYRVAVAATDDYLSEYVKYASNNDTLAIDNMYSNGYISYVTGGTKVFISDMGFATSKVKILEGDLKDLEVYVINECIEMK